MKEFKTKDRLIKSPECWEDLTLQDVLDFDSLSSIFYKNTTQIEKCIFYIADYNKLSYNDFIKLDKKLLLELVNTISFVFTPPEPVTLKEEGDIYFEVNNNKYCIKNPFECDMIGKYIVTEALLRRSDVVESFNKGDLTNIPKILAVISSDVDELGNVSYDSSLNSYKEQDMKLLPYPTALSICNFFLQKLNESITNTLNYLKKNKAQT